MLLLLLRSVWLFRLHNLDSVIIILPSPLMRTMHPGLSLVCASSIHNLMNVMCF